MAKPKRSRAERRMAQRALRKGVLDRERLASKAPGGARDRPIVVTTVSVIESIARSTPCPQCGGELDLKDHAAPGGDLRLVKAVCRLCHAPREIWFEVQVPMAN